jgi:hypothetical protein
MLNHLSTRFCLQLCSSLLNHINQSKSWFVIWDEEVLVNLLSLFH